ncbi:hypothetical protein O6H91_02G122200 [Diphasiastrum complanatum]|uniref:Uncharacterized protein n=2 Tax=Diphasiastrum complanatum TaxID=34168 RepID=A0ACC2EK77_DIPCM|nr:hypothetical protein O6H91_02G122200 [Diphasiastrum complanatum]KAJ7566868.1 hypothetical protein O6H91_02G122200 [Diphasiastrum complanatum]
MAAASIVASSFSSACSSLLTISSSSSSFATTAQSLSPSALKFIALRKGVLLKHKTLLSYSSDSRHKGREALKHNSCVCQAAGMAVEAETLNKDFGLKGLRIETGKGGLPKVVLSSELGSSAEIYLYGACVTSWKSMDGKDLLFVRPDAVFNGIKPISGGIPHCFPQFGPGEIQQHGFARNVTWNLLSTENQAGSPSVTLDIEESEYSQSMWGHAFKATYKVALEAERLRTELIIKNTDTRPFFFTTALHTYFSASIGGVSVKGLKGCRTLNKDPDPKNPIPGVEERDSVTFPAFVDCMYLNSPEELLLENGLGDRISIKNKGWTDAVLWNPYLTMEASYNDFVCVENAKLDKVHLQPGESWEAKQVISVV